MAEGTGRTIREAVGVFHDRSAFQDAIEELLRVGYDRADLSLLAAEETVRDKLGDAYERVQDLADDPNVPRAAYVGDHSMAEARTGVIGGLAYVGAMVGAGAVVASGGTLAAAIAAAALAGGGGGVLGGMASRLIGRERAREVERQLEHGGLLLWVRLRDLAHEEQAQEILRRYGADDVHVHDLPLTRQSADNPLHGVEPDPWLPGARI